MSLTTNLKHKLRDPDSPNSFSSRAREKRWGKFLEAFPDLPDLRVLDLGGTTRFWSDASVKPKFLTAVNLEAADEKIDERWQRHVRGDACCVDPALLDECDLIFSNSLIEHVGGYSKRVELCRQITYSGKPFWVQTPYRYFPIEPHYFGPGFQFLPIEARAVALRHWPFVTCRVTSLEHAREIALSTELIGRAELKHLLNPSEIWSETIAGLTKSLVAIRQ